MSEDADFSHAEDPAIAEALNMLLLILIQEQYDELAIRQVAGAMRVTADFDALPAPEAYQLFGIVDRLKLMADMDLDESSVSQSGHFELQVKDRIVCLQVKTIPSAEGEGVLVTRGG